MRAVGGRGARAPSGPSASSIACSRASSATTTRALLAELGVNCVRIPVNYRHFERRRAPVRAARGAASAASTASIAPAAPSTASTASSTCTRCPAAQNQHWHSDNPTHIAAVLAAPALPGPRRAPVAGDRRRATATTRGSPATTCSTSPRDPSGTVVGPVLRPARRAPSARSTRDHILFVDGNTLLDGLLDVRASPTRTPSTPATTTRAPGSRSAARTRARPRASGSTATSSRRSSSSAPRYQRETGTPIWVGEFGPVYTGDPERDEQRYQILSDQLDIYDRHGAGLVDLDLQGRRPAGARPRRARQRVHGALRRR